MTSASTRPGPWQMSTKCKLRLVYSPWSGTLLESGQGLHLSCSVLPNLQHLGQDPTYGGHWRNGPKDEPMVCVQWFVSSHLVKHINSNYKKCFLSGSVPQGEVVQAQLSLSARPVLSLLSLLEMTPGGS